VTYRKGNRLYRLSYRPNGTYTYQTLQLPHTKAASRPTVIASLLATLARRGTAATQQILSGLARTGGGGIGRIAGATIPLWMPLLGLTLVGSGLFLARPRRRTLLAPEPAGAE
jgi:hypothetical protein